MCNVKQNGAGIWLRYFCFFFQVKNLETLFGWKMDFESSIGVEIKMCRSLKIWLESSSLRTSFKLATNS